MKVLIPLTDNQIKLLLDCIDAESVHASNDQLKEELNEVLNSFNLTLGNIYKKPIEGLVKYHLSKE